MTRIVGAGFYFELRIDQYTGIQHPFRIERLLRRAKRLRKNIRALLVVPGTMIATDGVMVSNRAAIFD